MRGLCHERNQVRLLCLFEYRHFGDGILDFDQIIPFIMEETGYQGEWFAIDLCFWPDAWNVTAQAKEFLSPYLARY